MAAQHAFGNCRSLNLHMEKSLQKNAHLYFAAQFDMPLIFAHGLQGNSGIYPISMAHYNTMECSNAESVTCHGINKHAECFWFNTAETIF